MKYKVWINVIMGIAIFLSILGIASATPTKVICVPWQGDTSKYHTTWSGDDAILKCVIKTDGTSTIYYKWNYGDGTESDILSLGSGLTKYNVEIKHKYTGTEGTPFIAKLIVADNDALTNPTEDRYLVMIQTMSLDSKVNIAIDTGLWYLYKTQISGGNFKSFNERPVTVWSDYGNFFSSPTASAVQAFEINGHKETGDPDQDPYVESVKNGLNWLFNGYFSSTSYPMLETIAIGVQHSPDNPDSNGNGKGIEAHDYGYLPIYQSGMVMDAIIASGTPNTDTGRDFDGDGTTDTYREVVEDIADAYAWGQYDGVYGSYGIIGGWRYSWNTWPDNSAAQWAAIGLIPAQGAPWNVNIPQWVKDYNDNWLDYSHQQWTSDGVEYGGFGYAGPGNGVATSPSGMVQLDFVGATTSDQRWIRTERYFADYWNNWRDQNNVYAYYAFVKAMRLANPDPITTFSSNGFDWYRGDNTKKGLAEHVADHLNTYGNWNYYGTHLGTAWSVIILRPALFKAAPIACFTADPNPNYPDKDTNFNPSCSGHSETGKDIKNLKKFEWDWNNDGIYDESTTIPTTKTHAFPCSTIPCTYPVKLRVTDDSTPSLTSTYTTQIKITYPPHPPVADANGPYMVSLNTGDSLLLDGGYSYDPNEGKHEDSCPTCPDDKITAYDWDLKGAPWDYSDKNGVTANLNVAEISTFLGTGINNIGLKVTDNTHLAYPSGGGPDLTDEDFTTVDVYKGGITDVEYLPQCAGVVLSWTDIGADEYVIFRSDMNSNVGFEDTAKSSTNSRFMDSVPMTKTVYFRIMGIKGTEKFLSNAIEVKLDAALCTPVADPGGPYTVDVNNPVNLDGSGSKAKLGVIVAWDWDLDNDGIYDDAFGEKVQHTWNTEGNYNVGLRVRSSDSLVLTATASTTVNIASVENRAPFPPTSLGQFRFDGFSSDSVTRINIGKWIDESSIWFDGFLQDPDGDKVKLQIQWNGNNNFEQIQPSEGTNESIYYDSLRSAMVQLSGLKDAGYHWKARTVDEHDAASDWVEFGNNPSDAYDFIVINKIKSKINNEFQILWKDFQTQEFSNPIKWWMYNSGKWNQFETYLYNMEVSRATALDSYGRALDNAKIGDLEEAELFIKGGNLQRTNSGTHYLNANDLYKRELDKGIFYATVVKETSYWIVQTGLEATLGVGAGYAADLSFIAVDMVIDYYAGENPDKILVKGSNEAIFATIFTGITWGVFGGSGNTLANEIKDLSGPEALAKISIVLNKDNLVPLKAALLKSGVEGGAETVISNLIIDRFSEIQYQNAQKIKVNSPGELRVYDSKGNVSGIIDGVVKEEIPDSIYDKDNETLIILGAKDKYKYQFKGNAIGTYGLEILSIEWNKTYSVNFEDIPTSANETHNYTIDWDKFANGEKATMVEIDSNGDGIPEETKDMILPTASFKFSPLTSVVDKNITFDASESNGSIVSYDWEFGDGTTANGKIINHSYSDIGIYTVNLTVKDGNNAIDTIYERLFISPYNFTGFFQPIDNLPILNSVKAGSAIPVKFSLSGNQGLDIFAIGYPVSQKIICDSNTPTDDIEETVTAGSSSLSYDTTIDQYKYVWKTNKVWIGTCRNLTVKLKDGTYHNASFKFLK